MSEKRRTDRIILARRKKRNEDSMKKQGRGERGRGHGRRKKGNHVQALASLPWGSKSRRTHRVQEQGRKRDGQNVPCVLVLLWLMQV